MRDNSAQIASGKQLVFNQGLHASIDLNAEQHIYFLESNTFTPLLCILMSSVFPDYTLDRWSCISLHNPKKKENSFARKRRGKHFNAGKSFRA